MSSRAPAKALRVWIVGSAHLVGAPFLDVVTGDRGDELVSAHPDSDGPCQMGTPTSCSRSAMYQASACW